MNTPIAVVRNASAEAAGVHGLISEHLDGETRLLIIRFNEMDPQRREDLFQRSRELLAEMHDD
jgi:hypothetical protein